MVQNIEAKSAKDLPSETNLDFEFLRDKSENDELKDFECLFCTHVVTNPFRSICCGTFYC